MPHIHKLGINSGKTLSGIPWRGLQWKSSAHAINFAQLIRKEEMTKLENVKFLVSGKIPS
jgi:hypothetical protein